MLRVGFRILFFVMLKLLDYMICIPWFDVWCSNVLSPEWLLRIERNFKNLVMWFMSIWCFKMEYLFWVVRDTLNLKESEILPNSWCSFLIVCCFMVVSLPGPIISFACIVVTSDVWMLFNNVSSYCIGPLIICISILI